MAKSSSSRSTVRNAPQPNVHVYIPALVADDFGSMRRLTLATANSFAKKKLDTASQNLQLRHERQAKKARGVEARNNAAAERGLQAELRASDRGIRLFHRNLKTKVRPDKKLKHSAPNSRNRAWPFASRALPKYDGPVLDRRGARGVFARFRYYSRKTAEQGVSQRVVLYVFHGAEVDEDGKPYIAFNVGLTIEETLCAFDHLEQVNWSAQKNAKLLMHGILAVDHRQTPDEMMSTGTRWAEESLGRFGLPYIVTLHAPPDDGDQRNWHLHVLWSFRPLERVGDHEWEVGEMLRTDLDNPAAMKLMREMYAAVMTEVSFEAGQRQVYTAKSNADRGLPHEPQVHLGGVLTNRARNGEMITDNEENHERVMRSKAAVLDDELRHADEALAQQQEMARGIVTRWARPPALPARLPERAAAATVPAIIPSVSETVPRPSAVTAVLATPPPVRRKSALSPAPKKLFVELPRNLPRAAMTTGMPAISQLTPGQAHPARIDIANLRNQTVPIFERSIVTPFVPPKVLPAQVAVLPLPALPFYGLPRVLHADITSLDLPRITNKASISAVPVFVLPVFPQIDFPVHTGTMPPGAAITCSIRPIEPSQPPLTIADLTFIDLALGRIDEAQRREDERNRRDQINANSAAHDTQNITNDQQRGLAVDRLLAVIAKERHYLMKKDGRRTVDPHLLSRFELLPSDIEGDTIQKRFEAIANAQAGELAQIRTFVSKFPQHLHNEGGRWLVDKAAPANIRVLVTAWHNDRTFQAALAHVAATKPANAVSTRRAPNAQVEAPGAAWHLARQSRERAMAEWDIAERLDGAGLLRPGHGVSQAGAKSRTDQPRSTQRFLGTSGSGLEPDEVALNR